MLTIEPFLCSAIIGAICFMPANGPKPLIAIMKSQSSFPISVYGFSEETPALFTNTSIEPNFSLTSLANVSQASFEETSNLIPCTFSFSLAFSKASSLLSAAITVAPSLWNNPLRFIQFLIHTLTLYLNLKPMNDLAVFTYDYNELIVAKLSL